MPRSRGWCPKAQQHPQRTRSNAGGRGAPRPRGSQRGPGALLSEKRQGRLTPATLRATLSAPASKHLFIPTREKHFTTRQWNTCFPRKDTLTNLKLESHTRRKGRWAGWRQSIVIREERQSPRTSYSIKVSRAVYRKKILTEHNKGNCFVPQDSKTLSILQRWRGCLRKQWIRTTGTFSHPYLGKKKKNKQAATKASSQDTFWEPNAKSWLQSAFQFHS